MSTTTIGARIKARRQELKMSQRELAARMGYTDHTTITRIEAGKTDPPQSRVAQFATVLGVTPGHLMGWDQQPAEDLQNMGALAAELLLDPDAMEMARSYMQLNEADRYALKLVMASMLGKTKKTDAEASVLEAKKSFKKSDCNM